MYNLCADIAMTAQDILTVGNLAGTEWELPEGDVFATKHVAAINKEQYNKLWTKCAFMCSVYTHTHFVLVLCAQEQETSQNT
jgi:hypothetical protein